jgi:hypothetical protein
MTFLDRNVDLVVKRMDIGGGNRCKSEVGRLMLMDFGGGVVCCRCDVSIIIVGKRC